MLAVVDIAAAVAVSAAEFENAVAVVAGRRALGGAVAAVADLDVPFGWIDDRSVSVAVGVTEGVTDAVVATDGTAMVVLGGVGADFVASEMAVAEGAVEGASDAAVDDAAVA